ncbi:MAG: ROK family transcriptional regulator [Propionicimonas sp.]|uniref:ROK family transcriptional regulator n=1 Tax=Propionicimonas sp. TaxID=1955623 RepID=UPI002B20C6F3|nr:ROK family transcriptional regulator [Propionicimonas sp.]MEA4944305.1 ROK family transcriptional regulator [Propionicimonas sp.]
MTPQLPTSQELLVRAVRDHGPLSRQELVALTGLSPATVNRVTARLGRARILVAGGHRPSTGGRPSELLRYNGSALTVAGVSVTDESASGVVMSLDGEILTRRFEPFETQPGHHPTPEQRLDHTLRLFDSLVVAPADPPLAVGVAVPGVVGDEHGTVTAIHELGWDRLALGSVLTRRSPVPVLLENDANCLAIGEHVRGVGRQVDDLVAIVVRSGLGAGLIMNGRLYRGSHHEAGEIGYLLTGRESLRRLFPGRGELETLIGSERLTIQAQRLGLSLGPGGATLPHLITAGSSTGGEAGAFAEDLLDYIALAVSALCVVLDPGLVILGGGPVAAEVEAMVPRINERLLGRILRVPRIEPAGLGEEAIVVGAAQLALTSVGSR